MAWVAVDKNGDEYIFQEKPVRKTEYWAVDKEAYDQDYISLPNAAIGKANRKRVELE